MKEEAKRQRRFPTGNQVCVVCHLNSGLYLYIIDPNDGSDGPRLTLRLDPADDFGNHGFCVVGSKLYVFEGCTLFGPEIKSVFTFDLSSSLTDPPPHHIVRLDKTDLTRVGEMLHSKKYPIAVPTPDGKHILVGSSLLNQPPFHHHTFSIDESLDDGYEMTEDFDADYDPANCIRTEERIVCPDGVDFELYDTVRNSCTTTTRVPRIPRDYDDDVKGYALDEERSVFHLQTCSDLLSLELASMEKWGPSPLPRQSIYGGRCFLIGDDLCLCAEGVTDIKRGGFVRFPLLPAPCRVKKHRVALVGACGDIEEDGECDICVTRLYRDWNTRFHRLIVDVCSLDFAKYREDKEIVMRRKRSFEIVMGERPRSQFCSLNLVSMSSPA